MDQPGKVANPARGQLNRENNIPLSPCVPENLVSRDGFSRPVPRQPAHLHTQAESGAYLRDSSRVPRRRPFMKPPYAIGSVPSLSGHAIAYRWRSLPRVRRHRASKPQGSSERVLPWQITILFFSFFFSFISLIADGPHHYHPACGHKGSSHLSPVHALHFFLSRCKFNTLTTRQPMVDFYLRTFPRFPLRKKEHKSYFGKNRTHDFRTTSRCAAYLLDHSGDERPMDQLIFASLSHTHYWYEVGMLKVPAVSKSMDQPGKVANPADVVRLIQTKVDERNKNISVSGFDCFCVRSTDTSPMRSVDQVGTFLMLYYYCW